MTMTDLQRRLSSVGAQPYVPQKSLATKATSPSATALETVHEDKIDFTQTKKMKGATEVEIDDPYHFSLIN